MRLLIESQKLTIELASTKHTAADHPDTDTFVTNTKKPYLKTNTTDIELPQTPLDYEKALDTTDTSIYRYNQLPRRKSLHKRIGRIFLRISRMCSDTQCSAYAYQYRGGASELPAPEAPVCEATSFYEMPGSFPRVELESHDIEKSPTPAFPMSIQYAQTTPEHLQNYYKANRNATQRRAAPLSIASLSQLPRLEVPQSQFRVPRLISDHSPLTPSPISPMTPDGNGRREHRHSDHSQSYLDTISPCTAPKHEQIFAHYGSWEQQSHLSSATPSTASSYDPSYTTTPLSAYPPSAGSSFQTWSQPTSGLQPPFYPQASVPTHYNHGNIDTMLTGPNLWQGSFSFQADGSNDISEYYQAQDYQWPVSASAQYHDLGSQAQSCFEKQHQLDTAQKHGKDLHADNNFDDAPPAYSPVVPDPPFTAPDSTTTKPATTNPIPTNPPQRYPPAVCQQCGKVFTGKFGTGNCKRHVQQVHASIFERAIHMCKMCMKTYNRADALRKHQWKKHRLEDARPNKRRDRSIQ